MPAGTALAIFIASLLFTVGCVVVTRAARARRPLFRDAGAAAEGRSDVVFAVTIVLGFLLLIAGEHYDSSSNAARTEATTMASMAITAQGLPDRQAREAIQHSAVCYLRSARSSDWTAAEGEVGGAAGGSVETDRWMAAVNNDIAAASRRGLDAYVLQDSVQQARLARSERLYPGTPFSVALWVVSVISVAIVIVLLAMMLAAEFAWVQYLVTGAVALILTFMLVLIAAFSQPFSSDPPLPVVSIDVVDTALQDVARTVGANARVLGPCRLP